MESIKKSKMKDDIRVSIQNAILSGEIQPGDRLVETRIAADMGVSQAPVREALKELEHIGLVETRPYQGTYVRKVEKKDLSDAYDARLALELFAVCKAARHVNEKQLAAMAELLDKMNQTVAREDVTAFVEYDIEFHEAIIEASGNGMIARLWRLTNISLWTYVTTKLGGHSLENLANRHTAIYEALRAGDATRAQKLMQVHLHELQEELVEQTNW